MTDSFFYKIIYFLADLSSSLLGSRGNILSSSLLRLVGDGAGGVGASAVAANSARSSLVIFGGVCNDVVETKKDFVLSLGSPRLLLLLNGVGGGKKLVLGGISAMASVLVNDREFP